MHKSNVMGDNVDYITFIQVIACISVVFLHTNNCFWTFSFDKYWFSANIIDSLLYFPVPVFFMLIGITLLDYQKRYSTKIYLKKRFKKTVIPFIFWSMMAILDVLITKRVAIECITVKNVWNNIWSFGYVPMFWFFAKLFTVYLSLPLIAAVPEKNRKEVYSYILLAVTFVCILPYFFKSITKINMSWPVTVEVADGYIIFPMIGYLLYKYPPSRRKRIAIYVIGGIAISFQCIGTYILSMEKGSVCTDLKGYCSAIGILYGVAAFVMLSQIGKKVMRNAIAEKIIKFLSKYLMPIYLMQWFLLDFAINILKLNDKAMVYRMGFPFVIIGTVVVVVWIMRKIPVLRKMVP